MINITEKDKQLYEEWREERKKGLGDYFINNVAITSLVSTALFAVVLGILNLFNSKLSPGKIILFSVIFFVFFTLALAAFYYASWKKNEARFLKIKEYFEALPEYNQ